MINMKSFTQYIPSDNQLGGGVLFLRDKQGNDWYESQKKFSVDTLKIAYNSDGVICSAHLDASMLWPIDMSVAELKKEDVPASFVVDGNWVFDGKLIKARTYSKSELVTQATARRQQMMSQASIEIAPLQDAVDLDVATDEEKNLLKEWKSYRMLLNRVDTNLTQIKWPTPPQ